MVRSLIKIENSECALWSSLWACFMMYNRTIKVSKDLCRLCGDHVISHMRLVFLKEAKVARMEELQVLTYNFLSIWFYMKSHKLDSIPQGPWTVSLHMSHTMSRWCGNCRWLITFILNTLKYHHQKWSNVCSSRDKQLTDELFSQNCCLFSLKLLFNWTFNLPLVRSHL